MAGSLPEDPISAAAQLEDLAPGYLAHVRSAAARLAVSDREPSDIRAALLYVGDTATIDVDIPTASRRPEARYLKSAIKRLIGWYLRYVGQQVTAFGQAVTHLGTTVADRTEAVEARTADLESRVADLAGRVDRLERGGR